jgi:hypothetical protein
MTIKYSRQASAELDLRDCMMSGQEEEYSRFSIINNRVTMFRILVTPQHYPLLEGLPKTYIGC